jgi:hypothetical protein
MATTVYVKNIGAQTENKEIQDFFSFWCVVLNSLHVPR